MRAFRVFSVGMRRFFLMLAIAVFALSACRSRSATETEAAADAPSITVELTPDRPVLGPLQVRVRVEDRGAPVSDAKVTIEGNMSHPGMKPELADAALIEPGIYTAEITMTMKGDWFLLVFVELSDGRVWTYRRDLDGVGKLSP